MSVEYLNLNLSIQKNLIPEIQDLINKSQAREYSNISLVIDGRVWIQGRAVLRKAETGRIRNYGSCVNETSLSLDCIEHDVYPNPYEQVPFKAKEVGYE